MTEGFATFQANQLSFSRGNRKIWDKATWAMQGPSAILGANGSGKSSTLALLAGQVAPDQGELCFTSEGAPLDSEQWMTAISLAAPWVELPNHLTLEETLTFHGMFRSPRTGNMGWASSLHLWPECGAGCAHGPVEFRPTPTTVAGVGLGHTNLSRSPRRALQQFGQRRHSMVSGGFGTSFRADNHHCGHK